MQIQDDDATFWLTICSDIIDHAFNLSDELYKKQDLDKCQEISTLLLRAVEYLDSQLQQGYHIS